MRGGKDRRDIKIGREREEDGGAAAQLLLQQGECAVIEGRAVATGIINMCVAAAAANGT